MTTPRPQKDDTPHDDLSGALSEQGTDTPQTDALLAKHPGTMDTAGDAHFVRKMVQLARHLERKNARLVDALRKLARPENVDQPAGLGVILNAMELLRELGEES